MITYQQWSIVKVISSLKLEIFFLKFGLDFYRKLFSAGDERVDQTGERSRNSGRALLYDLGRQRTQRTKGLRSTPLTIFY